MGQTETKPAFEGWATAEVWRSVVGYESVYEVSNHGGVRRIGRAALNGNGRGGGARIGRSLKPLEQAGGYLSIQLWQNGKPRMRLIHCLVAEAFLGRVPERKEVNHKDGDKHNNDLRNLEYVTRSENNKHAYRIGLRHAKTEPMAAARRKPRVIIPCGCGCGVQIETPDKKGRSRYFVSGHNMKG